MAVLRAHVPGMKCPRGSRIRYAPHQCAAVRKNRQAFSVQFRAQNVCIARYGANAF